MTVIWGRKMLFVIATYAVLFGNGGATCNFPSDLKGLWKHSFHGDANFFLPWVFTMSVHKNKDVEFKCKSKLNQDTYLVESNLVNVEIFTDIRLSFRLAICLQLTKLKEHMYRAVHLTQESNILDYSRVSTVPFVYINNVCTSNTTVTRKEYNLLIKDGFMNDVKIPCPRGIRGAINFRVNSTLCNGRSDICEEDKSLMMITSQSCPKNLFYSDNNTFMCLYHTIDDKSDVLWIYNMDTETDQYSTFRFVCLIYQANTTSFHGSQNPRFCDSTQTDSRVSTGASKTATWGTLMDGHFSECAIKVTNKTEDISTTESTTPLSDMTTDITTAIDTSTAATTTKDVITETSTLTEISTTGEPKTTEDMTTTDMLTQESSTAKEEQTTDVRTTGKTTTEDMNTTEKITTTFAIVTNDQTTWSSPVISDITTDVITNSTATSLKQETTTEKITTDTSKYDMTTTVTEMDTTINTQTTQSQTPNEYSTSAYITTSEKLTNLTQKTTTIITTKGKSMTTTEDITTSKSVTRLEAETTTDNLNTKSVTSDTESFTELSDQTRSTEVYAKEPRDDQFGNDIFTDEMKNIVISASVGVLMMLLFVLTLVIAVTCIRRGKLRAKKRRSARRRMKNEYRAYMEHIRRYPRTIFVDLNSHRRHPSPIRSLYSRGNSPQRSSYRNASRSPRRTSSRRSSPRYMTSTPRDHEPEDISSSPITHAPPEEEIPRISTNQRRRRHRRIVIIDPRIGQNFHFADDHRDDATYPFSQESFF